MRAFEEALSGLNFSSGPGLGVFQRYATIGDALGWDGTFCRNESNLQLLWSVVRAKLLALQESDSGADDIRVFIKDEPHKRQKIVDGRLRLIMCVSLEDQMVDRILFQNWTRQEERHVLDIPGKTGWTPVPFGYRKFKSSFTRGVLATDCSAFDWTVPAWVSDLLLELMLDQTELSVEQTSVIRNRWNQVLGTGCVVRLPDGSRYRQETRGLMKSGWYRTIATNSDIQFLIHALAFHRAFPRQRCPLVWTMGDDVIMDWPPSCSQDDFEKGLRTTGVLCKRGSARPEFAGFVIEGEKVTPMYPEKHRFLLRHVPPTLAEQVATSYSLLYALGDGEESSFIRAHVAPHSAVSPALARSWAHGVSGLF